MQFHCPTVHHRAVPSQTFASIYHAVPLQCLAPLNLSVAIHCPAPLRFGLPLQIDSLHLSALPSPCLSIHRFAMPLHCSYRLRLAFPLLRISSPWPASPLLHSAFQCCPRHRWTMHTLLFHYCAIRIIGLPCHCGSGLFTAIPLLRHPLLRPSLLLRCHSWRGISLPLRLNAGHILALPLRIVAVLRPTLPCLCVSKLRVAEPLLFDYMPSCAIAFLTRRFFAVLCHCQSVLRIPVPCHCGAWRTDTRPGHSTIRKTIGQGRLTRSLPKRTFPCRNYATVQAHAVCRSPAIL